MKYEIELSGLGGGGHQKLTIEDYDAKSVRVYLTDKDGEQDYIGTALINHIKRLGRSL